MFEFFIFMELEKDEDLILDDGLWGSNKKLVLTTKRLLVQKRKGTVISKWEVEYEIRLEEIEEASGMIDVFTSLSSLILKLKNKEHLFVNFSLIDPQLCRLERDPESDLAVKTKEITNKYLAIIKSLIHRD